MMDEPYYRNVGHDDECATSESARTVCEGMYMERTGNIIQLCAALRAVYAIAGENPEVRKIVEDAISEHGLG